jgi:RNA polymerase-binding transcription factor DksA
VGSTSSGPADLIGTAAGWRRKEIGNSAALRADNGCAIAVPLIRIGKRGTIPRQRERKDSTMHPSAAEVLKAMKAQVSLRIQRRAEGLMDPGESKQDDLPGRRHEVAVLVASNESDDQELRDIEAALAKIEAGGYGACEACDDAISQARLHAQPQARFCLSCQEQIELREADRRHRRN